MIKKIIYALKRRRLLNFIPDKIYLKLMYYVRMGKKLNLNNPKTFNEKLQWLKLYDRKDIYNKMVDKYEVKKYIAEIIGEEYIIPTLGIYNKFDEINFDILPEQFVIKCTHDSGGIVICDDKSHFDLEKAKNKIKNSMKKNYFYDGREWPYKNIEPRIIIEKYMKDHKENDLFDYKIMCFNGIPKYTFVYSERFSETGVKATFFDNSWNELNFSRKFGKSDKMINKPLNHNKMLELSKKIASNIPFVRIDWYEVNGKLYFGEITFFPSSGFGKFEPEEWDMKLGNMIDLKRGLKNEK